MPKPVHRQSGALEYPIKGLYTPTKNSKFTRWLEKWWGLHYPRGGGMPPTLQEAFEAGGSNA